jgi:hypothetical protein
MTNIDRRRFVSTIGVMAACAAAAPTVSSANVVAPPKTRRSDERGENYGWCLARQHLTHPAATSGAIQHCAVDFWSKPLSAISLANHLPSEISRGVLWFDGFRPDKTLAERLEYIDSVHANHNYAWIEEPRFIATCSDDIEQLSSTFQSLTADDSSAGAHLRAALLHLDSMSPAANEPEWAQLIPALAPCYDQIIGYYNIQERGLRHLRAWWDDNDNSVGWENSFFKKSIFDPALQCNAVVFTSPALIETDPGLCPRASIETLIGELIRHFGYAVLDRAVSNTIVVSEDDRMKRRPRLFALGSVTMEKWPGFTKVLEILERQQRLVSGSFGDLAIDQKPIVVAITSQDQQLRRDLAINRLRTYSTGRNSFFEVRVPTYEGLSVGDTLELIVLWPFKLDAVERQIGDMA